MRNTQAKEKPRRQAPSAAERNGRKGTPSARIAQALAHAEIEPVGDWAPLGLALQRAFAPMISDSRARPIPCALCGEWAIYDLDAARLRCADCGTFSEAELAEALLAAHDKWWRDLPRFFRDALREPPIPWTDSRRNAE